MTIFVNITDASRAAGILADQRSSSRSYDVCVYVYAGASRCLKENAIVFACVCIGVYPWTHKCFFDHEHAVTPSCGVFCV